MSLKSGGNLVSLLKRRPCAHRLGKTEMVLGPTEDLGGVQGLEATTLDSCRDIYSPCDFEQVTPLPEIRLS